MDGFVETVLTVDLPHDEGILDVRLRSLPIPRDAEAILNLPLSRLAIKHGPRHWLMDRIVVTDKKSVLLCRECQLRLEVPTRANDLISLLLFWQRRYGASALQSGFVIDAATFRRSHDKRFPFHHKQPAPVAEGPS